jgi:hypothetical protein
MATDYSSVSDGERDLLLQIERWSALSERWRRLAFERQIEWVEMDARLTRIERTVALVLAHLTAERPPVAGPAPHTRGPWPDVERDAAILAAIAQQGPLPATDLARVVFGAEATRAQIKAVWQVLDRLVRQGSVIKVNDRRYDLPRAEAVVIPPVEAKFDDEREVIA